MKNVKSTVGALLVLCLLLVTTVIPAYAIASDQEPNFNHYREIKTIDLPQWMIKDIETILSLKKEVESANEKNDTVDEVPLYFQTDYPDVSYGRGTVKTNGCSITSLAMIATYMTDTEVLPDELAMKFGSRVDSNVGIMEYAAEQLDLVYKKEFYWNNVIKSFEEGKKAIVLVNDATDFTSSQHLLVLTGLTDDGKVLINDPNKYSYDRLKYGFENGFEPHKISCGFQGAWIFEKITTDKKSDIKLNVEDNTIPAGTE